VSGKGRTLLSGHRPVERSGGGRQVGFKAPKIRQHACGSSRRRLALSAAHRTATANWRRYTAWLSENRLGKRTLLFRAGNPRNRRYALRGPRSSADRAAAFEAACGGSIPPGAISATRSHADSAYPCRSHVPRKHRGADRTVGCSSRKRVLSMRTGKIPRRGEAALEAVTTLAVLMDSRRRLTSASRGEGAVAVVLSLAVRDVGLREMET
jgi:hypothetical protein